MLKLAVFSAEYGVDDGRGEVPEDYYDERPVDPYAQATPEPRQPQYVYPPPVTNILYCSTTTCMYYKVQI